MILLLEQHTPAPRPLDPRPLSRYPTFMSTPAMRIALVPNTEKSNAVAAAHRLVELLKPRAQVSLLMNPTQTQLLPIRPDPYRRPRWRWLHPLPRPIHAGNPRPRRRHQLRKARLPRRLLTRRIPHPSPPHPRRQSPPHPPPHAPGCHPSRTQRHDRMHPRRRDRST